MQRIVVKGENGKKCVFESVKNIELHKKVQLKKSDEWLVARCVKWRFVKNAVFSFSYAGA